MVVFVLALAALWQYTIGMAEKGAKRRFDTPLQIRVSVEQHALYEKAAEKDGRPLSNWARDRLEKAARRELRQKTTEKNF